MGQRAKIKLYPPEIRAWLDAELVRRGFSDYVQLAVDLKEESASRGMPVDASKSSIHRYGANLERKLSAIKASTEAARLIAAQSPDDADLRSGAVLSMIQTQVFDVMVGLQDASQAEDPVERAKLLARVGRDYATVARASVHQKRHEIEIRGKTAAAADRVAKLAKKGGLSGDTVDAIKREILGIAA